MDFATSDQFAACLSRPPVQPIQCALRTAMDCVGEPFSVYEERDLGAYILLGADRFAAIEPVGDLFRTRAAVYPGGRGAIMPGVVKQILTLHRTGFYAMADTE